MLYDLLGSGGEQARIAEIGCCEGLPDKNSILTAGPSSKH